MMRQQRQIVNNLRNVLSFPVIDICYTSRALGRGFHQNKEPLLKYKKKIYSNQSQFHNQKLPNYSDFQTLNDRDGLVHFFREMYMNKNANPIDKDKPNSSNSIPNKDAQNIPPYKRVYIDSKKKQHYYGPKILVVVCMYNQGIDAINLTLNGIYQNLKSLKQEGIAPQQVAVVLVQDGILKLIQDRNRRTYYKKQLSIIQFVKMLDKYQGKQYCQLQHRIHTIIDSIDDFKRKQQQNLVNQNTDFPPNIQKHLAVLYQNQWWPQLTDRVRFPQEDGRQLLIPEPKDQIKLNIFTCFKHMNGKKLSSHLWFFEGFCRYLQPQFVVLLDVGTTPDFYAQKDVSINGHNKQKGGYNGLTNMIRGFYRDKDIGGVTGLMSIDSKFPSLQGDDGKKENENCILECVASIQRAQQYEYIMAHFLDKNFESSTGFLHVLPGAWSAYRYIALIKSQKYEQNLLQKSYFTPILNPEMQQQSGYQQQNMYLAEDRILSLGIYCQPKSAYTLAYVPDGVAFTDPMKDHKTLLGQRRRWINSSLFAFLYVWKNYYFNVIQSQHSCYRSYITINLSMVFAGLSFINSYFTPSLYFFVLFITIAQIDSKSPTCANLATIVSALYCFIILAAVGGSLVGKQWQKHAHIVSGILSIFTFSMFALIVYNIVGIYLNLSNLQFSSFKQGSVIIMILVNIGSFFLIVLIHLFTHPKFVWKLITDSISYMSYQGAYSQTMVIYGMCNVDDVSWGTKGATGSGGKSKFYQNKVFFVSSWLFYNCILAYILIYIDLVVPQRKGTEGGYVLLAICIYATVQIGVKTILAFFNFVWWLFRYKIYGLKFDIHPKNVQQVKKKWDNLISKYKFGQKSQYP